MGREFRPGFAPELTPKQMLELGVFGGKYMTDCREEFPASWFQRAKISEERHQPSLNPAGAWSPSLSEGGLVTMPLEKTFWAPRYGVLQDRFGVGWMASVMHKPEGTR